MTGAGNFLQNASINDNFWSRIRETLRTEGIPYQWKALNDLVEGAEPSCSMRNFRIAAGLEEGEHGGFVFQDSDLAKWIEGAACSLRWHPDPELEATLNSAIDVIAAAQQPDGYLDTYYILTGLDGRWTNLKDNHELYCAGHFLEAAIACYRFTGNKKLLDTMLRYVDYIDSVFGPENAKLRGYPGHPELEIALMRLYDLTKDKKYLSLAKYFIDQRGQSPLYFEEEDKKHGNSNYWQDSYFQYQYYQAGKPVRDQEDAEGHAVRAMYLYSGMADVARETGDAELTEACRRLWKSTVEKRMYITGAIGSSEYGEAFTFDYDLPNDTIYGETCASIGLIFFARRMLSLEVKGEYADVMERALYNGVLSGMQLDGKSFFYVNPLEVLPEACIKDHNKRHVKFERQKWFSCACCPPNLIRLFSSLEDYLYSVNEDEIYVHLYAAGTLELDDISLKVDTDYPWDGKITLTVTAENPVRKVLKMRIPGWCRRTSLKVNTKNEDTETGYVPDKENVHIDMVDGYLSLDGEWQSGDTIELILDMPVEIVRVNPHVYEDAGKAAVQRGPIVYCLEEADNGRDLHLLRLKSTESRDFTARWKPFRLGGIVELTGPGIREKDEGWADTLYSSINRIEEEAVTLTFIPYYSWANRGPGEMRVFIRR